MSLHLLKLCVGASSVEDLRAWIDGRAAAARQAGAAFEQTHTTRMVPARAEELLDGGSLYWVIRGAVSARQRLLDIRPFVDGDGVRRCHLVLEPKVIAVSPRPSRPFQGWRYLQPKDAPADLDGAQPEAALPEEMQRELRALGLL